MNAAPKPLAERGAFPNRPAALEAAFRLAASNANTVNRPQTVGVVLMRNGRYALEGSRAAGFHVLRTICRVTVEPEPGRHAARGRRRGPIGDRDDREPAPP